MKIPTDKKKAKVITAELNAGNRFMTTAELAKYLSCHPNTPPNWRRKKKGPKYIKMGGRMVRYDRADVQKWENSNKKS